MYVIEHYITCDGNNIFLEYLESMKDMSAKLRIVRRLDRVALGNMGDHKRLSEYIWELRIDVGKGYRVYYSIEDKKVVLLLCAGSKTSQSKDIAQAEIYKEDYDTRSRSRYEHV